MMRSTAEVVEGSPHTLEITTTRGRAAGWWMGLGFLSKSRKRQFNMFLFSAHATSNTSRWQVRWRQPRRSFLHDCSIYDQHLLRFCTTFKCDPIPGGAAACASTLAASPSPYPSRFLNLLRRRVRGTSKSIRAHFSSVAVGPASPTARAHPHDPVKVSNHFKLVSYIV